MNARLHLQRATTFAPLPTRQEFQRWVNAALANAVGTPEITIRLVDEAESAQLNAQYRRKQGATNVLSFAYELPAGINVADNLLGDLVICAPLVAQEAKAQNKDLKAHWVHLVIHGVLHLLGYDHEQEQDAHTMETLEVAILAQLKFPNPY